jgi:hypothetical protein
MVIDLAGQGPEGNEVGVRSRLCLQGRLAVGPRPTDPSRAGALLLENVLISAWRWVLLGNRSCLEMGRATRTPPGECPGVPCRSCSWGGWE